jgi:phage terminase large subunit-like protein
MVNQQAFRMKRAVWNKDLLEEMAYFPFSTYKDQVDSGAGAFTILATPVQRIGAW